MEKLIAYFAKYHLLTNMIMLVVFVGGIFSWNQTKKEEWPDITFDNVRISVRYPGAPAEDVEYFVTKPLEEEVRGLDGVYRVTSTSSVGQSNVNVELEQHYSDLDEAITEIRNAVLDVQLPSEVIDKPSIQVFRSSKKAILDLALYDNKSHLLDTAARRNLQTYAFALENQLLNLSEVNAVNKTGYLQEEIQIKAYPDRLVKYELPFNTVMKEIKDNHVRKPAGTIETAKEPKVTLLSELNSVSKLNELVVQGGFEGKVIRLNEIAHVIEAYEKNKQITKVNGQEAIMLSVVKNSSYGILESLDAVTQAVENFKTNNLEGTNINLVMLDDESIDIRNRLRIISTNGAIGFVLILIMLYIFLNHRAAFWVAMGVPFTFCFTMLFAAILGQTINGMTLAAVIIVMGIVVDDAIVVAENITRLEHQGMNQTDAVVNGTSFVLLPIIASVVTTCVAFIPLYFFSGHFGNFVKYIPLIIFLMLGASLFESILILPGHMHFKLPFGRKPLKDITEGPANEYGHWFDKIEDKYGDLLIKLLNKKKLILFIFAGILIGSAVLSVKYMKFVLFPHEETRDVVLSGNTLADDDRFMTAEKTKKIENILLPYLGKEVVGFRTQIARSRRGGAVEENKFRILIEIVSKEKRKKSANQLIKELEKPIKALDGFEKIMFQKSRWGQSSGSPIEIIVQQNDDERRDSIVQSLIQTMQAYVSLENVEADEALRVTEYRVDINREKIKRLSINPADIASTFRAALEGTVLYEFSNGDEDVQVRFTIVDEAKDNIEKVLNLPVENKGNYLVPLRDVVVVEEVIAPNSIARRDLKRTTLIDADIKKKAKETPLEIATYFESEVFPKILKQYPTTTLSFGGEVQDTRESRGDLRNAIALVLVLIFIILALLFNSLSKPIIIMLAIPFGVVGIVLAFLLHGKLLFGFYAAIGALGLAGVVINDSIIMLVKLDKAYDSNKPKIESNQQVARIAQTRLRAVILTTLTTVAGVLPTAYGFAGYDAMLAEMMLSLTWGLIFGTGITLLLIPTVYGLGKDLKYQFNAM